MRIARFLAPLVAFASVALVAACGDSGTSSSTGDGETCTTASDCNGTPCATPVCNDSQCGTVPVAMGTVLGTQALGDCSRIVCDGQGSSTEIEDTTDVPSGAGDCQVGTCDGTTPVQSPKDAGLTCTSNGGKVCDGAGTCVECVAGTDCTSGLCKADHTCAPVTCTNLMKDGAETDIDCGGVDCPPCDDLLACMAPTDCESGVCTGMVCQVPTCTDSTKNGAETAEDCGGGACPPCDNGEGCAAPEDCVSGVCTNMLCATPSCTDLAKNGMETDVDCGGGTCMKCGPDKACLSGTDCKGGTCNGVTHTCDPTCTDTVKNGTETDVDCGGACPPKCALGDGCSVPADCTTNICTTNVCAQINGCDATNTMDMTGMAMVTITTSGNTWTPKCIKVSVGTNVTVNAAFGTHPLMGGEVVGAMKVPASTGPFVPITSSGTTKTVTMSAAGTFPYYCDVHALGGMTGVVFVE